MPDVNLQMGYAPYEQAIIAIANTTTEAIKSWENIFNALPSDQKTAFATAYFQGWNNWNNFWNNVWSKINPTK